MTPEILTSQKSKMETMKSQTRTETAKSQTRTETSKGQTKSDRTTASTASYTQMQTVSKTGGEKNRDAGKDLHAIRLMINDLPQHADRADEPEIHPIRCRCHCQTP
uniref:Uncharacterized protein n=1 Tax=Romanomermis culicivorax TaxID=13658 RepID=A0A915IHX9_ROMCU